MAELTYLDFATDEMLYLNAAWAAGMRYNAMVGQAQRICECFMKHIAARSLMNTSEVMQSHNLRKIYDYVMSMGIDISEARADIMLLNNFYTHTRYPGKDAFMATTQDVDSAVNALNRAVTVILKYK